MNKIALSISVLFWIPNFVYAGDFIYVQTNELDNQIIVYQKSDDGTLVEIDKVATGGRGTGESRPLHGGAPGPDPLASSSSLILAEEHSRLFASNAGDNSVSAFSIGDDGVPQLLDREASEGNVVNSLAYHGPSSTLYIGHMRGPEHIRTMSFTDNDLVLRKNSQSLDTDELTGRIQSHLLLSPDEDFLIANVLADQKPDGAGIHGSTEDNLVIFPVGEDGDLSSPLFHTAEGEEPFSSIFLNSGDNHFLTIFAESNDLSLNKLEDDGSVTHLSSATGDDTAVDGKPLEYCWVALSPDHDHAYLSAFGTGDVTSFQIDGAELRLAKSGIAKVPYSGDFKAAAGIPSSAPLDSWATDDGYFYQLYGSAGKLGAFRMTDDGGLEEIDLYDVPVNSVQGITGF